MARTQKLLRWQTRIGRHIEHRSYVALVVGAAALNAFLGFIPVEIFIVLRVLIRPKTWWRIALIAAVSSAIANYSLAHLIESQTHWADWIASQVGQARWQQAHYFINRHGALSLFLGAVTLLPLPPAVAICVMAKVPNSQIALSIGIGNFIKYGFAAWLAAYSPRWFGRKGANAIC